MRRPRLLEFERAWADAAFDAIYPEPPSSTDGAASKRHLVHGIRRMHPAQFLDETIAEAPLEPAIGLRLALWLVALSPIFLLRTFGTIASVRGDVRVRAIELLLASRIYAVRQLTLSLKALATMLYARSPAIHVQMLSSTRNTPLIAIEKVEREHVHEGEHAAE